MNYTPEEVAKILANRPNQPHYIESLIAGCVAAERERCAKICEALAPDPESYFEIAERLRECAAEIRMA